MGQVGTGRAGQRLFQCGLLYQNALPLITSERPAKAHDNGGAFAIPGGPPRQCSIAGQKILDIVESRAWQAPCSSSAPHSEHAESRTISKTTGWLGRLSFCVSRSCLLSDRLGET